MDLLTQRLLIGFALNLVFGTIAFVREMVDDTGFFAGIVIFTLIYVFLDWQGYAIILAFFAMTGAAITAENKDKADKGEFELYKAKRPVERVLGRSLAGTIFAAIFFLTDKSEWKFAFIASYAESIFDTISAKLGMRLNKNAISITNFKITRHGTPGAISWQGTLLGLLAALVLSIIGFIIGMITFNVVLIILIASTAGAFVDSLLNAFSYQKKRMPNELINFLGSLSAGIICLLLYWFLQLGLGIKL